MPTVVAVDPSLTISGCVSVTWHPGTDFPDPYWETWRGRAGKGLADVASVRKRMRAMLREILALAPRAVDLAVVEGPSFGSRTALSLADERAGLRWMLIDQLLARGPVVVVPPKTRAKLATGDGNANKPLVFAAVTAALPGVRIPDHNVADAAALAIAGAHSLGLDAGYSPDQLKAFRAVAWSTPTLASLSA